MKQKIFMFIALLLLALPLTIASPLSTFGGGTNNPSTSCGDYPFIVGSNGIVNNCSNFNDPTLFVNVTRGDATSSTNSGLSWGAGHLNITMKAGVGGGVWDITQVITGKSAPSLQVGQCMDLQVMRNGTTEGATLSFGFFEDTDFNTFDGSTDDFQEKTTLTSNSATSNSILEMRSGIVTSQNTGHFWINNVYMNITLCVNTTTKSSLWLNNSNNGAFNMTRASPYLLPASTNFSIGYVWDGSTTNNVWSIKYLAVYNGTTGAPQVNLMALNITFTATDLYDASSITNFSVGMYQGGTLQHNFTTTNGTIPVSNITNGFYNLTFQSPQAGGYFENSYSNVDVSGQTFNGQMFQTIAYFNASEVFTGNMITSFNASVPLQFNTSNSTGLTKFYLKSGDYNISGASASYLNQTLQFSVSALSTNYFTIANFSTNRLRIDAKSIINGAFISAFSIQISNGTYTAQKSTTTGNLTFNVLAGTWIMNFSSSTHANQNDLIVINTSSSYPNFTFSVYTTNSFNFTFFDEKKLTQITDRAISVQLISDLYSANYTTTNGVLYTDLVTPELYLIRFSATDYNERHYYFSLNNGTNNQLKLYMINSTLATRVTGTVIDQSTDPVEGAYIKVLRYELPLNAYTLREVWKTDVQGETDLNIIKNDEFYQFIIEQPFGTIKLTTEPAYIIKDYIFFQILFTNLAGDQFFNSQDIAKAISFNNDTNSFRITYSDPNNLLNDICFNIYRVTARANTIVNQSCVTTASGTIILRVANESGATYLANAIIDANYLIGSLTHTFTPRENDLQNDWGPLLDFILTVILAFIGSWSIPIMIILITMPTLFLTMFEILPLPIEAAIALTIISIVVSGIIWRRT